jgi:hypothetical protein
MRCTVPSSSPRTSTTTVAGPPARASWSHPWSAIHTVIGDHIHRFAAPSRSFNPMKWCYPR